MHPLSASYSLMLQLAPLRYEAGVHTPFMSTELAGWARILPRHPTPRPPLHTSAPSPKRRAPPSRSAGSRAAPLSARARTTRGFPPRQAWCMADRPCPSKEWTSGACWRDSSSSVACVHVRKGATRAHTHTQTMLSTMQRPPGEVVKHVPTQNKVGASLSMCMPALVHAYT